MRICSKFNLTATVPLRPDNKLLNFDFGKKGYFGELSNIYLDNYFLLRKDEYVLLTLIN